MSLVIYINDFYVNFIYTSVRNMSRQCQADKISCEYNSFNMNDEDKKYLKKVEKLRPDLEVFRHMVQILQNEHTEINRLFAAIDSNLLENYKLA